MNRLPILMIALLAIGCGEKRQTEQSAGRSDTVAIQHDQAELSRIAVQEDAAGTAYGNILRMKERLGRGDTTEARQLAEETRYLLLAYLDSVAESDLPRLEERAKNAIYHLDRILFYLDHRQVDKAQEHIDLCRIHLDSLRQLTGIKRLM